MLIREMQQFSHLRSRGDSTISARHALLEDHQEQVMAQAKELQEHLQKIESTISNLRGTRRSNRCTVVKKAPLPADRLVCTEAALR